MLPCRIDISTDHFRKRFLSHRRIKKVFISDRFMFLISKPFFAFESESLTVDVFSLNKSLSCILKRTSIVNGLLEIHCMQYGRGNKDLVVKKNRAHRKGVRLCSDYSFDLYGSISIKSVMTDFSLTFQKSHQGRKKAIS